MAGKTEERQRVQVRLVALIFGPAKQNNSKQWFLFVVVTWCGSNLL
jgi:hypothetical protein